jgi:hypothetical protein
MVIPLGSQRELALHPPFSATTRVVLSLAHCPAGQCHLWGVQVLARTLRHNVLLGAAMPAVPRQAEKPLRSTSNGQGSSDWNDLTP